MGKRTIDIRVRLKVSDASLEALLDEYLHGQDTPYPLREMVMVSLLTHWLPLVYQQKGAAPEKVHQSLVDANYRWQLHLQYLQDRTGIALPTRLSTPASSTHSPASAAEDFDAPVDAEIAVEEEDYPALFEFTSKF